MAVRGGLKLAAFLRKAKSAQGSGAQVQRMQVGFYATSRYQDGTAVTNVAATNEFGDRNGRSPRGRSSVTRTVRCDRC